eukprot:PhM_4_TR9126/c0_g1_i1/m.87090/K02943/RP-LP2, RPLP2; large subunit ribosomal protein LP2
MKYLAAYALVALNNDKPSQADVEKVLKAAGVAADKERLKDLFAQLEGKNIQTLMAEGASKLQTLGGGAAAAPAAAAGAAAAPKKEEKKKEAPPPEEDEDMGLGLFD